ncbi:hypothetical protein SAMN02927914_06012 [Mesorhizobium qingshengii]|uniref:Uncharacterized protein n=1 Tax=Mesorhizobium qingshengii TaxID=1165689 RepID=A0A1G5ZUD5_9HYPH|nr:hypothetical protein [Mesorhizobium qingshengii]SDA97883.1 hypothetical protein SAMN02927914_06012 [Mesorhizobium qingshengii]
MDTKSVTHESSSSVLERSSGFSGNADPVFWNIPRANLFEVEALAFWKAKKLTDLGRENYLTACKISFPFANPYRRSCRRIFLFFATYHPPSIGCKFARLRLTMDEKNPPPFDLNQDFLTAN